MTLTININLDKKCLECSKGGATGSGLCMKCLSKAFTPNAKMKTAAGKAAQIAVQKVFDRECATPNTQTTAAAGRE